MNTLKTAFFQHDGALLNFWYDQESELNDTSLDSFESYYDNHFVYDELLECVIDGV